MPVVEAVVGDITKQDVDAIVNAANSSLMGGAGVDGAIHRAAGPELLDACREARRDLMGGLPVGEAVATPGFRLPARWVVHTVGPNRGRGQTDPRDLASCYARSLEVAAGVGARSIAFPAIGCGIYGWDGSSAPVAVEAVRTSPVLASFDLVRFVLFGDELYRAFASAVADTFPEA